MFIETRQGKGKIIGFFPTNQITLYLLHWFCSDNEIITVCCRPEICTLIVWFKSSCLYISLSVSVHWHIQHSNINQISIYMFAQSLAATVCDGQNMMTLARSLYNTSIKKSIQQVFRRVRYSFYLWNLGSIPVILK